MKSTFYWSNWKFTIESSCYYDDEPGNVFYLEAIVMPELELVAKSELKGWNRLHHQGTGIIAPAIRWTACGCGRTGDTRYTERLSFQGGCPPVSDCDGAPPKLKHSVQIWLSRFVYRVGVYRVGGIVDGTLHNATLRFLSPRAQSLANCRDTSLV